MFEEKMFSEKDWQQIYSKGITREQIEIQLENFRNGFPFAELAKPSTPLSGLKSFDEEHKHNLAIYFIENSHFHQIVKFVPASGAATRMFSHLHTWLEKNKKSECQPLADTEYDFNSPEYFIQNIRKFAFFGDMKSVMAAAGYDLEDCIKHHKYVPVIDFLLNKKGLNYSGLPKALIKFHTYDDINRTALDEHLAEAAELCRDLDTADIHFSISPEHIEKFEAQLKISLPFFEQFFKVKYRISHSEQKTSTDIIAVDNNNQPFRNADGSLLFRPGGHGALIYNLNDIDADIVFIKNIDNVSPDYIANDSVFYKKVLAGYLFSIRYQIYEFLRILDKGSISDTALAKIIGFVIKELSHELPEKFHSFDNTGKVNYLHSLLNRPIRVCGMVKNLGEPGGGPFFVKDQQGNISQQIVESSQIDHKNEQQLRIMKQSTHFNPVDLICSIKDYKGKKFDLLQFVDPATGFITGKTKDGRPLKAQELPGLWNGAMAFWNTIFVEVPISTFNPVKTVNDLLRKEHLKQN
ncbi:MAG TPA: DUF4301 family protein [Bacteroidales bacterium]|nr:DUF4301 family protein [Bacteroidales bacterium]